MPLRSEDGLWHVVFQLIVLVMVIISRIVLVSLVSCRHRAALVMVIIFGMPDGSLGVIGDVLAPSRSILGWLTGTLSA